MQLSVLLLNPLQVLWFFTNCDGTTSTKSDVINPKLGGNFYTFVKYKIPPFFLHPLPSKTTERSLDTYSGKSKYLSKNFMEKKSYRDPRFFLIFGERPCGEGGSSGVCLPPYLCFIRGGTASGLCNAGFAVCCSYTVSCGDETSSQSTLFTDAKRRDALPDCILNVRSSAGNICQLRLDFEYLELDPPSVEDDDNRACTGSALVLDGSKPSMICGTNSQPGQHIYVDVRGRRDPWQIRIALARNARWRIRVTQITCNSEDQAPAGCSQYFSGNDGFISSFNYKENTSFHLQESYSACIRPETSRCRVHWKASQHTFKVSSDKDAATDGDCDGDSVVISGANFVEENERRAATLFCGSALPDSVISNDFRIRLSIKGDQDKDEDWGFRMQYRQLPCP